MDKTAWKNRIIKSYNKMMDAHREQLRIIIEYCKELSEAVPEGEEERDTFIRGIAPPLEEHYFNGGEYIIRTGGVMEVRRRITIGKNSEKLMKFIDGLPSDIKTLAKIARMDEEDIAKAIEGGKFE